MPDGLPIFLVGMPGSGKSYLGSRLATLLQRPFVDLDNFIESKEATKIKDLLDPDNEANFRELEHRYLLELLDSLEDHVVALGGGTPCFFDHTSLVNADSLPVTWSTSITQTHGFLRTISLWTRTTRQSVSWVMRW